MVHLPFPEHWNNSLQSEAQEELHPTPLEQYRAQLTFLLTSPVHCTVNVLVYCSFSVRVLNHASGQYFPPQVY